MIYRKRFHNVDAKGILAGLEERLADLKFQTEKRDEHLLSMRGPEMNSTRQNALLGISSVDFRADGKVLKVDANLGEQGRLLRLVLFIVFTPFAIAAVVFSTLGMELVAAIIGLVLVIQLIVWAGVIPFFTRVHRRRTEKALEDLVGELPA